MRNHECGRGCGFGPGAKAAMIGMGMIGMGMRGRGGFGRGGWGGWGGGPWGDDGEGRGGRHGRRRGRMFAGGELRLLLLRLIADESRHGYELIKAIEELTGGEYAPSPGVVYPTLSLLVDEGKIAEAAGDGPRKAFTVTDEGVTELEERGEEADRLIERLQSLAEDGPRQNAPIRRAVANLFIAVRERARAGGHDADTAHQIAEILDEAARKIERL
jgi:DNA-binding PadR family transcriptional regulator